MYITVPKSRREPSSLCCFARWPRSENNVHVKHNVAHNFVVGADV